MKKIEQVFREILYRAIEKENRSLTQLGLSKKMGFSLSTINLALKKLEKMNAVKIGKMNFKIIDLKKILYYWASIRDIEKDIIYQARIELPVREIERAMPNIIYATYSAYKLKFKDVPADYSEVYIYADEKNLKKIKKRFSKFSKKENQKNPNLFILKLDENMKKYSQTGTIAMIFVDLWNLRQWYASDFLKALEKKLNLD